jgi:hypothetical protein
MEFVSFVPHDDTAASVATYLWVNSQGEDRGRGEKEDRMKRECEKWEIWRLEQWGCNEITKLEGEITFLFRLPHGSTLTIQDKKQGN